jgi:hypothetical protein
MLFVVAGKGFDLAKALLLGLDSSKQIFSINAQRVNQEKALGAFGDCGITHWMAYLIFLQHPCEFGPIWAA